VATWVAWELILESPDLLLNVLPANSELAVSGMNVETATGASI
jgi:hypothetical protein